ncbi:TPA: hypothetical protein ACH3X3_007144 [Trebouxia sp. C0006]
MDHAGSADMLALGSHCSVPDCQQIDFLPFTCDCCGEVFCLQHRTYQSHSCSKAGSRETGTIVCPICAKAVKLTASDDPNAVFERHSRQDCDPANYAKVHQRPKCPAKGCREKLGAINTYTCKECGAQVCLKHRFPEAHQCPGKSASLASAAGARASQLTQSMRSLWGRTISAPAQQPAQKHQLKGDMLRPQSVETSQQRPQSAEVRQKSQTSSSRPASAGAQQAERCPDCGAGFTTVQALIRHSESVHQHQHGRPQPVQRHQPDSCPHCGKMFPDAVALVHHVEHSHSDKAQCVLC